MAEREFYGNLKKKHEYSTCVHDMLSRTENKADKIFISGKTIFPLQWT